MGPQKLQALLVNLVEPKYMPERGTIHLNFSGVYPMTLVEVFEPKLTGGQVCFQVFLVLS